jgi:hypothetical protein
MDVDEPTGPVGVQLRALEVRPPDSRTVRTEMGRFDRVFLTNYFGHECSVYDCLRFMRDLTKVSHSIWTFLGNTLTTGLSLSHVCGRDRPPASSEGVVTNICFCLDFSSPQTGCECCVKCRPVYWVSLVQCITIEHWLQSEQPILYYITVKHKRTQFPTVPACAIAIHKSYFISFHFIVIPQILLALSHWI